MPRPAGNTRLKAARLAAGFGSQQALADALGVGVRQVRRWESENPPRPQPEVGKALTRLLGQDLELLGFPPSPVMRGDSRRAAAGASTTAAMKGSWKNWDVDSGTIRARVSVRLVTSDRAARLGV